MRKQQTRREQICDAAVALAARGGSHALTHQAVDAELGIAKGSTSYYYRTRAALITAVADHLTMQSRAVFHDFLARHADDDLETVMSGYLEHLSSARNDQVRARLALALDAHCGIEQRTALARCLFSEDAAIELMRSRGHSDPTVGAAELLDRLEGHVLRTLVFAERA